LRVYKGRTPTPHEMCQSLHSMVVRSGLWLFLAVCKVFLCQSLDLVGVIFVVGSGFFGVARDQGSPGSPFFMSDLRVLVFVVLAVVFVGAGELFEEVRVLYGGGDFVVAASPLAEVEKAAAVGAEGKVFAGGQDDFAAGGAEERFGCRGGRFRHTRSLILFRRATKQQEER
jgi:hypothetical protein